MSDSQLRLEYAHFLHSICPELNVFVIHLEIEIDIYELMGSLPVRKWLCSNPNHFRRVGELELNRVTVRQQNC